ncbi:MAG TPA: FtsX-like permease family protein, partial [Acidimicrobiales bacterium]|nr:FtsX-like permease family protein [Acidimicrobiales bacterium]
YGWAGGAPTGRHAAPGPAGGPGVPEPGRPADDTGPAGFPDRPAITTWQQLASGDSLLVQDEQAVLAAGVVLLVLLSVASVAVLAGGRMAEHTRRTGLIKAVGGSPTFVAATLLVENLWLALAAAAVGLAAGWLAAPVFTSPGVNLVGTPGPPSFTFTMVGEVVGLAVLVALIATVVPAVRAARTSTVVALADAARPPRRRAALIAVSRRLPVPLLLGLRLVARRPRRALLSAASIAVTTTGVVTVLTFRATAGTLGITMTNGLSDPVVNRDEQMLTAITVVLGALALLNAVCCAWATVLDARGASALSRALGASPRQVGAGVAAAQVIPAVPGILVGLPLGLELFAAAGHIKTPTFPPAWWLVAAVVGMLVAVAALAGIPARIGPRRSVGEILQSEMA